MTTVPVLSQPRDVVFSLARRRYYLPSRLTPSESVRPGDIPLSGLLGDCSDIERSHDVGWLSRDFRDRLES